MRQRAPHPKNENTRAELVPHSWVSGYALTSPCDAAARVVGRAQETRGMNWQEQSAVSRHCETKATMRGPQISQFPLQEPVEGGKLCCVHYCGSMLTKLTNLKRTITKAAWDITGLFWGFDISFVIAWPALFFFLSHSSTLYFPGKHLVVLVLVNMLIMTFWLEWHFRNFCFKISRPSFYLKFQGLDLTSSFLLLAVISLSIVNSVAVELFVVSMVL